MNKYFSLTFYVLALSLIIVFPDVASGAVRSSLNISASKIIPSIFPLIVLSEVGVSYFYRKQNCTSLVKRIFFVFVISNLCGFPLGAKLSAKLKKDNVISDKEAILCSVISNNAGPSFVISFVGEKLFSNGGLGIIIYLVQVFCSVITGLLYYRLLPKQTKVHAVSAAADNSRNGFIYIFKNAVTGAAVTSLNVMAFMTVFTVLKSYCVYVLSALGASPMTCSFVSAVLEISGGCVDASELMYPYSVIIASFAVGFSGASVIFQSIIFLKQENIDIRPFVIFKLINGAFTAFVTYFIISVLMSTSLKASAGFTLSCGFETLFLIVSMIFIISYFTVSLIQLFVNIYNKSKEKS